MKYLTLGLAAAILSFTAVTASPAGISGGDLQQTDAGSSADTNFDYIDYDDLDTRDAQAPDPKQPGAKSAPKPGPKPGPKPDPANASGANGTDAETPQEKQEDKLWEQFDKALDQNECARNNPHGFDQKRLTKECDARHGKLQAIKIDNPSPITYMVMPTDLPKNGKLPKASTATYPPHKASMYVCDCTKTKVPTIPTGAF